MSVGLKVGSPEGTGLDVGKAEGAKLGTAVGAGVGAFVGDAVGVFVGATVGTGVGAVLGASLMEAEVGPVVGKPVTVATLEKSRLETSINDWKNEPAAINSVMYFSLSESDAKGPLTISWGVLESCPVIRYWKTTLKVTPRAVDPRLR